MYNYNLSAKLFLFFLQIQRILLPLYIGHRFSIGKRGSNRFIDMSVLYRKNFFVLKMFLYLVT